MLVIVNETWAEVLAPVNLSMSVNGTAVTEKFCEEWPGASHPYFQAANVLHLAAFVVPHNFQASALLMRSTLCVGQIMFMLWAALNICAADILAWNVTLTVINLAHSIYLAVNIWPPLIPDNLKDLYLKLFVPLKVNRRQFRSLTKAAKVKWLEKGTYYAVEDMTLCDQQLSILLKGKLRVTCDSTYLHCIFPNQFIDSAEWESAENGNADNLFQVSLIAEERSQYITWNRQELKQLLDTKSFLKAIVHCLIGKDITTKLYSLNEYKPEDAKAKGTPKMSDLLNEKLMQRSRSADALHMGSKGFIRSDVWMAHKLDSDLRSIGGSPLLKRSTPGIHVKK